MQQIDTQLLDDFHQKFLNFYSKVKGVMSVRLNQMKEKFNLKIDTFPEDQEVFNIQQTNKLNLQTQPNKPKKNWTDDDKKVLIWLVGKWVTINKRDLKQLNDIDWSSIASMMPRRDAFKCKQKWLQMLKLPLQQAPWTFAEDNLLQKIIYEFQTQNKGNKWSQIATALNKANDQQVHRNGKQCRERWNNHLNPNINRNPWQLSEDLDLMCLAKELGKKWALISKKLKVARSENNVKNRFNCLLRKEKSNKSGKKDQEESQSEENSISNQASTEELSHEEIKLINFIIKKIEWRIQQSENIKQKEPNDAVKEEHQEVVKKVRIDGQGTFYKEFKQKISNFKNIEKLQLQVKESQLNDDEVATLMPCLINKENNQIYFASPEQLYAYLNKTSDNGQVGMQQENYLSNPNSLGSIMYDPKLFRSIVMLQSNEFHQGQSGIYNQRSFYNQNHMANLQSLNSYPYSVAMSPYPSQANLTNQLQK
ncbi:unnamed protein product (macronuclear) [Paramecium tetraurelia]|uniref:Uncharacterized protein n=1 Tax=Paramecium tetraurelia TaxID=5888 RepID=A0CT64_PARTE|nr:uncharacterized protein GSPATT00010215001 [Paramecium tetraurelia]CAK73981.1 unnamed protein product [Paramecium tetraurelia]|eukprot:XP_001441378.1 hypothetical protein (macronuclear) [Paramecium tetraurelia strain d4-2]